MRLIVFVLTFCLAWPALAQPPAARTVATEALHMAVSMTEHQMNVCAKAHPQRAGRFAESANLARGKLEAALEGLRPQRTQELSIAVPELMVVGREIMAALMATESASLPLDICERNAKEIAEVSEREATALLNQLVTTLLSGIAVHQQGMNRALR